MYRIRSQKHNPYTWIGGFRKHIYRWALVLLTLYVMLSALPKADYIVAILMKIYSGCLIAFALLVCYSILSDRGKDYSGQFIEVDHDRIVARELGYAPFFEKHRQEAFKECLIYFKEIKTCYYRKPLIKGRPPNTLVIELVEDYKRSSILDGKEERPKVFTISDYGYQYRQFYAIAHEFVHRYSNYTEVPEEKNAPKKRTIEDVITDLSENNVKFGLPTEDSETSL